MKRYKLVTQDYKTRAGMPNETVWQIGVRVEAHGEGNILCTDGVIHFYDTPAIATFMNPAHAEIDNPRCIVIETENEVAHDGSKGGCKAATMLWDACLPQPTTTQRAYFAIKVALDESISDSFRQWAGDWISGVDRSRVAAWSPGGPVEWAATRAATWGVSFGWAGESAREAAEFSAETASWAAFRSNNKPHFLSRLMQISEEALRFESGCDGQS